MKHWLRFLSCVCMLGLSAAPDNTFSVDRIQNFYNTGLLEEKALLELSGASPSFHLALQLLPQKVGYVPFMFENRSENPLITFDNMYIVIKGTDPATGDACFVQFDSNGIGSCVDAVYHVTDSADYTIALSTLPVNGNLPYVYMPSITSARLYMAVDYKLILVVNSNNTIADPNPAYSMDTAYNYLYDKVEFNIEPNQCVINPTLVDCFCLPLPIQVIANGGCNTLYAGMPPTQNREAIFTGYQNAVNALPNTSSQGQWGNLLLTNTVSSANPKNLRILSTDTAMTQATPIFDTAYLDSSTYGENWITEAWNTYFQENLTYMDISQVPGYGIYSGQVDSGTGYFKFNKQSGTAGSSTVWIALPSMNVSVPFFAGTGFNLISGDGTAFTVIEKFLSAGMVSGILPAGSSMTNPINNEYFQSQKPYYQNNPNLTANTGPWYDLYSSILHSYAVYPYNFYTYAYDDVLGNDDTITSSNIILDPINIIITLGNMVGTTP